MWSCSRAATSTRCAVTARRSRRRSRRSFRPARTTSRRSCRTAVVERTSRFVCGYLNCDQRFSPLVEALPTMLLVRSRDDYSAIEAMDASGSRPTVVPQGSGTWLGTTLKFTINEARTARPGNAAMLGRLTELMFVEILREYMHRLPAEQGGWLAALNDPHVGKALAAAARESRFATGPSTSSRVKLRCRARCWRSGSRSWSAKRRCGTSPVGGCSSRSR